MTYFIFILSLLNPIYSLIFSINESIKHKSSYLTICSFALAFAGISWAISPPIEVDLYRHYLRIEYLNGMPLNEILQNSNSGYLLFDSYAWLLNSLGLPKQFFPASIVFISYVLVLSVFKRIKSKKLVNIKPSILALSFLIAWLSIDFVLLSSGIRSTFSSIVIFYFAYQAIYERKFISFILAAIFAFFIHPGSIGPSLIVGLSLLFHQYIKTPKVFVYIGVILIFGSQIVHSIVNYISVFLSNYSFYSAGYLSEDSGLGAAALRGRNLNGIIGEFVIARLPGYVGILYLLLLKPKDKDKDSLSLALCLGTLYLGLFFQYFVLYERFSSFFVLAFSVFIILEYARRPNKFNFRFMVILLISLIAHSIFHLYRYSDYLLTAKDLLYKPLLFIIFNI